MKLNKTRDYSKEENQIPPFLVPFNVNTSLRIPNIKHDYYALQCFGEIQCETVLRNLFQYSCKTNQLEYNDKETEDSNPQIIGDQQDEERIPTLCDCLQRNDSGGCSAQCPNVKNGVECPLAFHISEDGRYIDCGNQALQRGIMPKCELKSAGDMGKGVFAEQDIRKGQIVFEYVGEIITNEQSFERQLQCVQKSFYFYEYGQFQIDSKFIGNESRYVNHSCEPNLETYVISSGGRLKLAFVAVKKINKGKQLFINYFYRDEQHFKNHTKNEPRKCLCGQNRCTGFLDKHIIRCPVRKCCQKCTGFHYRVDDQKRAQLGLTTDVVLFQAANVDNLKNIAAAYELAEKNADEDQKNSLLQQTLELEYKRQ